MNIRIQILIVVITLLAMFYVAGPCTGNQPADEYAVLCRILLYAAYYFFAVSICVQAVKQGEETDTGDGAAGGAEKKSRRRE